MRNSSGELVTIPPKPRSDGVWCRDRRKLTFYFIAEKRIDFRELVRELFRYVSDLPGRFGRVVDLFRCRVFKTRIWLSALSSSGNYEQ